MGICIYIYMYTHTERERERYIYIYMYANSCVKYARMYTCVYIHISA